MKKHSKIFNEISVCSKIDLKDKLIYLSEISEMENNEFYARHVCFNRLTNDLSKAFVWRNTYNVNSRNWLILFDLLECINTYKERLILVDLLEGIITNKEIK